MYGINPPRFMNGVPYIHHSEEDAIYMMNHPDTNTSNVWGSTAVYTGYMYANNWTCSSPGRDAYEDPTDFQHLKGFPALHKWVVSKAEKQPNVLLTDLNKSIELPDGEGSKGFILIPDNLNPRIKANLDYYLKKAGLLNVAPRFKDRTIKKNAYLPTKLEKRKRGWFWRFKRKLKTRIKNKF